MSSVFPYPDPLEPDNDLRAIAAAIVAVPAGVAVLSNRALDGVIHADERPCTRTDDPDVWFPERLERARSASGLRALREQAAQLCGGCPVSGPCLELALRVGGPVQVGIVGGTSAQDRKRILPWWKAVRAGQVDHTEPVDATGSSTSTSPPAPAPASSAARCTRSISPEGGEQRAAA